MIEGSGKMLILAVGVNSQTGAIYKMLGAVKEKKCKLPPKHIEGETEGDSYDPESADGSLDIPLDDPKLVKKSADSARKMKNHSVFQSKLNAMTYKIGFLGTSLGFIDQIWSRLH